MFHVGCQRLITTAMDSGASMKSQAWCTLPKSGCSTFRKYVVGNTHAYTVLTLDQLTLAKPNETAIWRSCNFSESGELPFSSPRESQWFPCHCCWYCIFIVKNKYNTAISFEISCFLRYVKMNKTKYAPSPSQYPGCLLWGPVSKLK